MQLTREQIKKDLYDLLVAQNTKFSKSLDSITDESNLRADLGLDSIQMLYFVILIETKFEIEFDNTEMSEFKTFGDIINYIQKRQQ